MAIIHQLVNCTFPKQQIREPILYNLGQQFQIVPNIRGASINDDIGLVSLELEGEEDEVNRAVDYLRERKVKVEVVEPE